MEMAGVLMIGVAAGGSIANLKARSPWLFGVVNALVAVGTAVLLIGTNR